MPAIPIKCSPSQIITLDSPVGAINIETCHDGIHSLGVECTVKDPDAPIKGKVSIAYGKADDANLKKCVDWVTSYFKGNIMNIEFPLCSQGFTKTMESGFKAVSKIPPGESMTYGDLNRSMHRSGCARSLGAAMGRNRHLILIPCHRAVHADGKMKKCATSGYLKPALLAHEKSVASSSNGAASEEEEENVNEAASEESEPEEKPEPKSKARKTSKKTEKKPAKKTESKVQVKEEKQNGQKVTKKDDSESEAGAEVKTETKAKVKHEPEAEPKAEPESMEEDEDDPEETVKAKKTTKKAPKAAPVRRTCGRKRKMAS